jgi:hypothetical protein
MISYVKEWIVNKQTYDMPGYALMIICYYENQNEMLYIT